MNLLRTTKLKKLTKINHFLVIDHFYISLKNIKNMLSEKSIKILKREWIKRIYNQSGIVYKCAQKDLIESFIKDLENINKQ